MNIGERPQLTWSIPAIADAPVEIGPMVARTNRAGMIVGSETAVTVTSMKRACTDCAVVQELPEHNAATDILSFAGRTERKRTLETATLPPNRLELVNT